jgi:hypothetical protein
MKLLAKNQLIGTHGGFAVFRDLFEKENGERVSVPTSREFEIQKERTLPNGKLTNYPPEETMFAKHRL